MPALRTRWGESLGLDCLLCRSLSKLRWPPIGEGTTAPLLVVVLTPSAPIFARIEKIEEDLSVQALVP